MVGFLAFVRAYCIAVFYVRRGANFASARSGASSPVAQSVPSLPGRAHARRHGTAVAGKPARIFLPRGPCLRELAWRLV